jgi:glutamyl-tRNA reductase
MIKAQSQVLSAFIIPFKQIQIQKIIILLIQIIYKKQSRILRQSKMEINQQPYQIYLQEEFNKIIIKILNNPMKKIKKQQFKRKENY